MTASARSVPVRIPGLEIVEHEFELPLDHAQPDGERITVFVREVAAPGGRDRPALLFLQGGPGFEAARPSRAPLLGGWMARALEDFRLLLLDQRGTGRSTPIGGLDGLTPEQQADRLALFRADSIVADAELIREALGIDRWSLLGQSFGGFCAVRYLSSAPDALRSVLITGGLPPIGRHVDEVYAATWERMRMQSARYYAAYPEDRERVRTLHRRLADDPVTAPDGSVLSSDFLRFAGHGLGMSDGPETAHHLLELPADSPAFRVDASQLMGFTRNPLYALVHEASYNDGDSTAWSAERTMPDDIRDDVTVFRGEHLYPGVLRDVAALRPLADAGELIAQREWGRMYDEAQLRANTVPVAAAVYLDDPYVDARFSLETAELIGARTWATDEYLHNGLRADGARILDRLLAMADGRL